MSIPPALQWPAEGNARVPYRVFADPEIYREELARIFLGPTWQFLTLAGELPEAGDYLTTFLGETPVIVTRGKDGAMHAMVNRCAHRGNLVCLKRRGHADNLTCVYHAWRYDLEGNLDSVAFRRGIAGKGGMPESFRLEDHGLKKLAVDQFGDLVFGTLSPDAPPLHEYIGNQIGSRVHRVLHGKPKVLGTTSQILHNNWKLYFENVRDTYHATLLHSFFTTFRMSRLTSEGGVDIAENGAHHASYTRNKIDRVGVAEIGSALCRHSVAASKLPAGRSQLFVDERGIRRRHDDPDSVVVPEFCVAADPKQHRAAAGIAKRTGQDRVAMDLSRL